MAAPNWHPMPGDPDADIIESMFDVRSEEWILTTPGDYQAAAAIVMREDGTDMQRVIVLEWPGRVNHSDELRTVRLMMSPEDALELSRVLAHSARFQMRS